jgi:hypothetical protein
MDREKTILKAQLLEYESEVIFLRNGINRIKLRISDIKVRIKIIEGKERLNANK